MTGSRSCALSQSDKRYVQAAASKVDYLERGFACNGANFSHVRAGHAEQDCKKERQLE
jgi:hypothetical protein